MSLDFGKQKQEQSVSPFFASTGRSSISGNQFSLDPEVERLRQQATQGLTQAAGQYGGQLSQLQSSAFGNLPDYVNAQIAPLQQNIAQQRGQLAQNIAQRRLGGSSFANQAQRAQAFDAQRALQDARAQAIASGVGQAAGLAGQQFGAQQNLAQMLQNIAQQRLMGELGIFGLGKRGSTEQEKAGLGFSLFGG